MGNKAAFLVVLVLVLAPKVLGKGSPNVIFFAVDDLARMAIGNRATGLQPGSGRIALAFFCFKFKSVFST